MRAAFQQRHCVADRCQRIAQFVRERRQELVLAPIGVPQRLEELIFGVLTRVRLPADRVGRPPEQADSSTISASGANRGAERKIVEAGLLTPQTKHAQDDRHDDDSGKHPPHQRTGGGFVLEQP